MATNRIHVTSSMKGINVDPIRVSNTPEKIIYLWSSQGFTPSANDTVAAALYESGSLTAGPIQISNGTVRCMEAKGIIDSNGNLVVFYSAYAYSGGGANPYSMKYAVYSPDLSTVIVPETVINSRPDTVFRPNLYLLSDGRILFVWMRTATGQSSSTKAFHAFILNSDYTTNATVTQITGNTSALAIAAFDEVNGCLYAAYSANNADLIRKIPINVNSLGSNASISLSNATGALPSRYDNLKAQVVYADEEGSWTSIDIGDYTYLVCPIDCDAAYIHANGTAIFKINRSLGSYEYIIVDAEDLSPEWAALSTPFTMTYSLAYSDYEELLYVNISMIYRTATLNIPATITIDLANFSATPVILDNSAMVPYLIDTTIGTRAPFNHLTYNPDTGEFSNIFFGGTIQADTVYLLVMI